MPLTVGSLFSGIGGLDLGLERAGMTVKWQSEIDPYASKVLAKHWPDVPNLGDVTKIEWETVERVDLICGGFPCQPVSRAGRKRAQDDERWLWPEVVRCVRGIRPRFVVVENVPGLLTHGLGDVLGDLAELGFDAEWESIPAAAVGAPHLRDRVFIVAWSEHGWAVAYPGSGRGPDNDVRSGWDAAGCGGADVADTQRCRWDGLHERIKQGHLETNTGGGGKDGPRRPPTRDHGGRVPGQGEEGGGGHAGNLSYADRAGLGEQRRPISVFAEFPSIERGGWWSSEPDVGRVAHGVPHRVDRLRALGNAVVPQIAEYVGRRIVESCDA